MNFLNIIYKDTNMLTSNFKNIDANQIATARQVYGVACHFAKAKPKAKVAKKVAVKATAKPTAAKKAAAKPKAATKKPTLTNRIDLLESKMDAILKILSNQE